MKRLLVKSWLAFLLLLAGVMSPAILMAEDDTCLNGYELTAIVVLETDIKQSVDAYACRMVLPDDTSTYDLYNQLRSKWGKQRSAQRKMRDDVYQRIYGDNWQVKVDGWTLTTARDQGKIFKASDSACQSLRNEMGQYGHDWQSLYNASARDAAAEKYDPLRCKAKSVITIKQ